MDTALELASSYWPHIAAVIGLLGLLGALATTVHAVLHKTDSRAVVGWVGLAWLSPVIGTLLYVLLGVNRIHRHALKLRAPDRAAGAGASRTEAVLAAVAPADHGARERMPDLVQIVDRVTDAPLLSGCAVDLYDDGDPAYDAMIEAIGGATRSVALCSYIFDDDAVGRRFVEALGEAVRREVEVRVLVDYAGSRYSKSPIGPRLQAARVPFQMFLPAWVPWRTRYFNLRNHRKLLVVDGRVAFTGGMNIRAGHAASQATEQDRERDAHFRVRGPVVAQLQQVFVEDWQFAAHERLEGVRWFPMLPPVGPVAARAVPDGPDVDLGKAEMTLHGGIAASRRRVLVATPYFLPEQTLATALTIAAMRGVQVDIVLPQPTNSLLVEWASQSVIEQVMAGGCNVWLLPPPFDHSKLMVVDSCWTFLGSANWDPRSLALNFELNVEAHDPELADSVERLIEGRMASGKKASLEELRAVPPSKRLRNGLARLFAPYL